MSSGEHRVHDQERLRTIEARVRHLDSRHHLSSDLQGVGASQVDWLAPIGSAPIGVQGSGKLCRGQSTRRARDRQCAGAYLSTRPRGGRLDHWSMSDHRATLCVSGCEYAVSIDIVGRRHGSNLNLNVNESMKECTY